MRLRERAKKLFGADLQLDWYVSPARRVFKTRSSEADERLAIRMEKLHTRRQLPCLRELQNPSKQCCNKECGADIEKIKSSIGELRFHDLRHHAITELAESQASDRTIMSIAGHVSQQMLAHYSHVRIEAKRKALDASCSRGQNQWVTPQRTTQNRRKEPFSSASA